MEKPDYRITEPLRAELFRYLNRAIKAGIETENMGKMYDLLWNADTLKLKKG